MNEADYLLTCEISIGICVAAFLTLFWLLRRNGPSFGLPFAYMALLLLNHVPGAFVPLADPEFDGHLSEVAIGIKLTTIGVLCFVIGVWHARRTTREQQVAPQIPSSATIFRDDKPFWIFCLLGGWLFTFGMTPLRYVPSIGAVIINGGAVWMLGVMLGLRWAVQKGNATWIFIWLVCLAVYPAIVLVTSGFLSYGAAASLIVVCVLAVTARRSWKVIVAVVLVTYIGLSGFSNYFQARDNIRDAVWDGATLQQRLTAISQIFTQFKFFDTNDQLALAGVDLRLNQNYFVGLSAENLDNGQAQYLYGSSVTDALLSVVPRIIWPNKTVFGGSPEIVMKMTGLNLSTTTSFGVGNVMEFYINFGLPGLIGGFLLLGWGLGRLDHRAALAEARGDYPTTMLFFLPGVALIQPIGSLVELTGSATSAWIAAYCWQWAWHRYQEYRAVKSGGNVSMTAPLPSPH